MAHQGKADFCPRLAAVTYLSFPKGVITVYSREYGGFTIFGWLLYIPVRFLLVINL